VAAWTVNRSDVLTGVVTAVFRLLPRFTAGRLRTLDGRSVRFAGNVFAPLNAPVSFQGHWETHGKYGLQFAVDAIAAPLELDPAGLVHYLANHRDIRGIGPAKAQRIVDAFGQKFDHVIRNDPAAVAAAAKVGMKEITNLQCIWVKANGHNAALTQLSAYGLTHHQVTTLVEKFGDQVVTILKLDPYTLLNELPGFGFRRIDKVAGQMGTPKTLPARLRSGLLYAVGDALGNGHCWLERGDLLDRADALLVLDTLDSRQLIEKQLGALIKEYKLVSQIYAERVLIADLQIFEMEQFLASVFRRRQSNPRRADLTLVPAPELNPDQQAAVANAVDHAISLISGGAGTGKTFTINEIIRAYERAGLTVELAAPTGKAARRLEQSVNRSAQTLHRLLGFNGFSFERGPDSKIEADVLVVDELSMVDVRLAFQLVQAVDLQRTAVVLVGDHNQLPAVGPGNVLLDLVKSRAVPTTILRQVFRQAGALKENSAAVLNGTVPPTSGPEPSGLWPWQVYTVSDIEEVLATVTDLFTSTLAQQGFDVLRDVQVLTPTHKGPLGTVALNRLLQRLIQKKVYGTEVPAQGDGGHVRILIGDKVMQTRNDYNLDVMNGSIGYVVEVQPDGAVVVDFENRLVEMGREDVAGNLQLAYATTVHKLQGSEFPAVITIVHKAHWFVHDRNLLYTAVTRAQKASIILGDRWGIQNCVCTVRAGERNTFLSVLLPPVAGGIETLR
jgi:exodeoxyribonuclease V alpha subunit